MPRLSLWSNKKGADYRFIDRAIAEFFGISGTALYMHKYLGVHEQVEGSTGVSAPTTIQDVLLLENRDRKYADDVIELRGLYNVGDVDFDMKQFGMFLSNDTLFIEVHLNDCLAKLGRKAMAGDVLELPHLRDDAPLDMETPAMNKFYVIEEVNRASDGYGPTWFPHILRLKCSPMAASEEYSDILDKQAKDPFGYDNGKLRDILTTIGVDMNINEEIVEAARENVSRRNFETRHFYVVPGEGGETGSQNPWVFAGDGNPPNGAEIVDAGNRYPSDPTEGDYFLRNDYTPSALYQFVSGLWRRQEVDYRQSEWTTAHRILNDFLNNKEVAVLGDGLEINQKQSLHRAVKPRADF